MDSIFHSRPQAHQEHSQAQQLSLVAQFAGRNPHLWRGAVAKQNGQTFRIQLVRLFGHRHPPLGLVRIERLRAVTCPLYLIHDPAVMPSGLHRDR